MRSWGSPSPGFWCVTSTRPTTTTPDSNRDVGPTPDRGRGQALLRDIHALKTLYPEDPALARWAHGVQRLYAKAREWAAAGGRPLYRGQLALEKRLLALCPPFLEDPLAVQAKLCRRIERHIKSLPRT